MTSEQDFDNLMGSIPPTSDPSLAAAYAEIIRYVSALQMENQTLRGIITENVTRLNMIDNIINAPFEAVAAVRNRVGPQPVPVQEDVCTGCGQDCHSPQACMTNHDSQESITFPVWMVRKYPKNGYSHSEYKETHDSYTYETLLAAGYMVATQDDMRTVRVLSDGLEDDNQYVPRHEQKAIEAELRAEYERDTFFPNGFKGTFEEWLPWAGYAPNDIDPDER